MPRRLIRPDLSPTSFSWAPKVRRSTSADMPLCRCWTATSCGITLRDIATAPMPKQKMVRPRVTPEQRREQRVHPLLVRVRILVLGRPEDEDQHEGQRGQGGQQEPAARPTSRRSCPPGCPARSAGRTRPTRRGPDAAPSGRVPRSTSRPSARWSGSAARRARSCSSPHPQHHADQYTHADDEGDEALRHRAEAAQPVATRIHRRLAFWM